jgi:ribosome-associated toxin RatA of RatAB toxin-antitoxin module
MPKIIQTTILDAPVTRAYKIVSDVERYPEFLPGCQSVSILESVQEQILIRVDVSWSGFSDSFVTKNRSILNERIQMDLSAGPFNSLDGVWSFSPIGESGSRVGLELNYELKGIAKLGKQVLERAVDVCVEAFQRRIEGADD